jgi:hypothetical protein
VSLAADRTSSPPRHTAAPGAPPALAGPWVTWRSALLALAGVGLVCGLTPYNDYVVANTFMVGGYLPPVLAITFFVLVVGVNAPLHRWRPRAALSAGELATVMGVMLVACAIPTQGLMRMLLPQLVAPFRLGADNAAFWSAFTRLDLPGWLFPVESVREGLNHRNATDFYNRVQPGEPIPYGAWVVPLAAWGAFVAGAWAALIGMSALVWRQWSVNERLPFPIAQAELALIEPPRPGRAFNDLLASRVFWIGFTGVLLVHALGGLNRYFPRVVPAIPLTYDFRGLFTEVPFVYFAEFVKTNTIYFTFIGISYFIQSRVSFSLWSILLIREFVIVALRTQQVEVRYQAWEDQYLGAALVLVGWIGWVGRHHWAAAVRAAVGRGRDGDADATGGGFLSPRAALGLLVGGAGVMAAWLLVVGVSPLVVVGLIGMLLMAHLVTARVVAEAGLPFMRFYSRFDQVYTSFPPSAVTGRDVYFAGVVEGIGPTSTREGLATFATHALQVHAGTSPPVRQRSRFVALLAAALVFGYVVAAGSSLRQYYTYATPITPRIQAPLNEWGAESFPRALVANPLVNHDAGRYPPRAHSRAAHVTIGAAIMAGLYVATVRLAAWPFMPIGYLLCFTGVLHIASFSLFLGWLTKVLLVRFGGARTFQAAKPLFVGLIFGEALAAGLWLVVTLVLAGLGVDYVQILVLPG